MAEMANPRTKRTTFGKSMTVLTAIEANNWKHRNGTNVYDDAGTLPEGHSVTTSAMGSTRNDNHFDADFHGNINIVLGGAMLSGVLMVVVGLMCYCCHRNIRKNRPQEYSQYWRTEPDVHSLEVFTTEAHAMCYEGQSTAQGNQDENAYGALSYPVTPLSGPGPPPTYDSLMFDHPQSLPANTEKKPDVSETSESIVSSVVSTLLGLTAIATSARAAENNNANRARQETSGTDDGLPTYEAALKLDANGYV